MYNVYDVSLYRYIVMYPMYRMYTVYRATYKRRGTVSASPLYWGIQQICREGGCEEVRDGGTMRAPRGVGWCWEVPGGAVYAG